MSSGPTAQVHLANVVANWRALGALNPGSETGAVVKAGGYGHGAAQVAQALSAAGCQTFFTAHAGEGVEVRRAVGNAPVIYVLNGPDAADLNVYSEAGLRAIINTPEQLDIWRNANIDAPLALKFDTGMNRLGLRPETAGELATAGSGLDVAHIMSHLACADEPGHTKNAIQLKAFSELVRHFPGIPASLANSAGCYLGGDYAFDLTRPGIALYGGGHAPDGFELKPGLTLTAPVLSVHTGRTAETVGYGATKILARDAILATVALGYADGLPRSASNSGFGVLGGVRCPIVGRISMDLTTLDVTGASEWAKPGARIEFIGAAANLEEQADCAGTLGYELITGLGSRVERLYE